VQAAVRLLAMLNFLGKSLNYWSERHV